MGCITEPGSAAVSKQLANIVDHGCLYIARVADWVPVQADTGLPFSIDYRPPIEQRVGTIVRVCRNSGGDPTDQLMKLRTRNFESVTQTGEPPMRTGVGPLDVPNRPSNADLVGVPVRGLLAPAH